MKKHAKILSLFIALFMLFALALPASAYITSQPVGGGACSTPGVPWDPCPDEWQISRIYHWVVRGETLGEIADAYGTVPYMIIENNWNYFNDLWLRDITRWTDREKPYDWDFYAMHLENGVRLFIYDLLTVKHYVVRGDTLNDLAGEFSLWGGTLALYDDAGLEIFRMKTTVDSVKNENADWFRNLDLLNTTHAANVPLMESNNIFAYYRGLVIDGYSSRWDGWTLSGSPLYISVPVQVGYCVYNTVPPGAYPHPRIRMGLSANTLYNRTDTFKVNASEDRITATTGEGAFVPLIPAQRIYANTTPVENPVAQYNIGWTRNLAEPNFAFDHMGVDWFRNLKMDFEDGWYVYGTDPDLPILRNFGEVSPWEGYPSWSGNWTYSSWSTENV
ncbi:MAG: hypothetical protein FWD23_11820, partial [Oscillospiraceae bacterium]|nr:hypothetical protein [Oscillospiraceae bacterium]